MRFRSVLIVCAVLCAAAFFPAFCSAAQTQKTAEAHKAGKTGSSAPARKVPLHYKCNSCGSQISRDAVKGGGFIAKCPNCGEPFLTM